MTRPMLAPRFARLLDLKRPGPADAPALDSEAPAQPGTPVPEKPEGQRARRVMAVTERQRHGQEQPSPESSAISAASQPAAATTPSAAAVVNCPAWAWALIDHLTRGTPPPEIAPAGFAFDVPLDSQALPDTRLRITVSPETIELRFTPDTKADGELLWAHRDALHHALAESVGALLSIHIEID